MLIKDYFTFFHKKNCIIFAIFLDGKQNIVVCFRKLIKEVSHSFRTFEEFSSQNKR